MPHRTASSRCKRLSCGFGLLLFTLATPGLKADFSVASGAAGSWYAGQNSAPAPGAGSSSTSNRWDEGAPNWHYTVRPGETLTQIAEDLLKPGKGWPDLVRVNSLADRTTAVPGSTLQIPMQWLKHQPRPAQVLTVAGSVVRSSHSRKRPVPLRDTDVLNVGDRVRTFDGRATIKLADGSMLLLEPRSQLVFDRMTQFGRTGMADTRLRLENGSIGTRVQPLSEQNSRFRIETPSAVAAVRGTAFRITSHEGQTRLEVTEGQVSLSSDHHQQLVNAGFAAETGPRGAIRQYRLPPAPTLAALPSTVSQLPLDIHWQGSNQAAAHQVNLFDSDSGQWIENRRLGDEAFALDNLDNGNYTLEVAAISDQGFRGMPATTSISIDLTARPATLKAPADGALIAEDEPLRFQWSFQGASESAQVQVSRQREFSNVIATTGWGSGNQGSLDRQLAPGTYFWRVVTRAGGSSVARSPSRSLIIKGDLESPDILNINYVDNDVRLFWRNVSNAQGYLLQLARDPDFSQVIKEVKIPETTAALRLAPGQHYFVRLRGVTDGPLESHWSPGRELYVE